MDLLPTKTYLSPPITERRDPTMGQNNVFTPAFAGYTNDSIVVVLTNAPADGIIVQTEDAFYSASHSDGIPGLSLGVRKLSARLFVGPDGFTLQEIPLAAPPYGYCHESLARQTLQTQHGAFIAESDDSGVSMFWRGQVVNPLQEEHHTVVVNDDGVRVFSLVG